MNRQEVTEIDIRSFMTSALNGPGSEILTEFFAWSAASFPTRTAVQHGGHALSYGALHERASRLARYLRAQGVGRGDFIGLYMPRGIDMIVGLLGILEAGATYVPIDPEYPHERVRFIAEDCGMRYLLTTFDLAPLDYPCPCLLYDRLQHELSQLSGQRLSTSETGILPADLAYVIYTSGTTGRPKGVMIRHESVCHFIRADASIMGLTSEDVVLQGASIAFDLSIEEIWITFLAGAKLVISCRETMGTGPELARTMAAMNITVWHCVPTLLAMQETDIPSLRLINVGGEACPSDFVRRWHRKGRRLLNTYGPTETTVSATYAELEPTAPITIGRPLPGYQVFILSENLDLLADGEEGELCISGPGLAKGYLNQPELTDKKFVPAPFLADNGTRPILYRSGDRARRNQDGQIEYLGRFDTQVKIRGFRVELGEIDAVLLQDPGIKTAVTAMLKDPHGIDTILSFVVPLPGVHLDENLLAQRMRMQLPPHMVPAGIEVVKDLPLLPSGKVDRTKLRFPERPLQSTKPLTAPKSILETRLHGVWSELFPSTLVSTEDDFFLDLGGHSLKAALLVSKLRKEHGFDDLSIQDIYKHPTIRKLAEVLECLQAPRESPAEAIPFQPVPPWRYRACVVAQTLALCVIFGALSTQWILPLMTYLTALDMGYDKLEAVLPALVVYMSMGPLLLLLGIATKWLVMGRYREGDYPLWGTYYFRWWFARRMMSLVPDSILLGTPIVRLYLRALGAKIGRHVHIEGGKFDAPDLLNIGDDTCIGRGATLSCCAVERGLLRIRRINIGKDCFIGNAASVGLGARMEDGAFLDDLSLLSNGCVLPAGESWSGSPAKYVGLAKRDKGAKRPGAAGTVLWDAVWLMMILVLPAFSFTPVLPGLLWIVSVPRFENAAWYLALAPALALTFLPAMCVQIAALKWLVLGRVQARRIPLASFAYLRFWFVDRLMALSVTVLHPLYATLYLIPWYRLLGIKLGKRAEVSTASSILWDLLKISDECFIADGVSLGAPRAKDGHLDLRETAIGKRTFLGNNAYLPGGARTGQNVLIGCLSRPPDEPERAMESSTSWFGSPAIFLPQRQILFQFDEKRTFRPPPRLYAARLSVEFIRILLPLTSSAFIAVLMVLTLTRLHAMELSWWQLAATLPVLYVVAGLIAAFITVSVKYLVIGRYKPHVAPLWSFFVWRSEGVTCLYENLVAPFFMAHLRGTPYINCILRWMGCKIGRRVYNDTTDITEHDVVAIGDDVSLNDDCGLQTHLFEDRVMKISHVTIGDRCSVGADAIVLYDSVMEEESILGDLSMVMKGEVLPRGTEWEGSPAQRIGGGHRLRAEAGRSLHEPSRLRPHSEPQRIHHLSAS